MKSGGFGAARFHRWFDPSPTTISLRPSRSPNRNLRETASYARPPGAKPAIENLTESTTGASMAVGHDRRAIGGDPGATGLEGRSNHRSWSRTATWRRGRRRARWMGNRAMRAATSGQPGSCRVRVKSSLVRPHPGHYAHLGEALEHDERVVRAATQRLSASEQIHQRRILRRPVWTVRHARS